MKKIGKSELLEAILASAKDHAILAVSPAGEIVTWSAGAALVFGYTEAEAVGIPFDILFTPRDRANGVPQREIDTARLKGRAPDVRWHLRKDGSRFWADGVMQPIHDPHDALVGYVKILRDATESHESDKQIARLARADPLTGLANRAEFADRFADMTAAALLRSCATFPRSPRTARWSHRSSGWRAACI